MSDTDTTPQTAPASPNSEGVNPADTSLGSALAAAQIASSVGSDTEQDQESASTQSQASQAEGGSVASSAGNSTADSASLETSQVFKIDDLGRMYATGRRKTSSARVWLKPGTGDIKVNGKSADEYFRREVLRMLIRQGLMFTDRSSHYDVYATVKGGGLSGQGGAVRHAIATALARYEPELRTTLKQRGLLTRDSRVVERKKYGRAKARRSFQFSKR